WSAATIWTPFLFVSLMSVRMTSPSFAYSTMFLATSEMAVAMIVKLLLENPICDASARPCCRASTMSADDWIRTRTSCSMSVLETPAQEREPLLEIQGRRHVFQGQSQLHHGQGDL